MSEVIAKSKAYKVGCGRFQCHLPANAHPQADRQRTKDEDEDARIELDKDLGELRGLLGSSKPRPAPRPAPEPAVEEGGIDRALLDQLIGANTAEDDDVDGSEAEGDADAYDRFVRELVYEPRVTGASDRLKTDEEIAQAAKQQLEAAERSRLLRMRGEEEDEFQGAKGRAAKRRRPEADDLDDDFVDETEHGLGRGLDIEAGSASEGEAEAVALSGSDDDEDGSGEDADSEEGSEEEEDDSAAGLDVEGLLSDDEEPETEELDTEPLVKAAHLDKGKSKEIAYTFPCPASHDDFLSILEQSGKDAASVATVVQRIRTLYHPKLGGENKSKMEVRPLHTLSAVILRTHRSFSGYSSTTSSLSAHAMLALSTPSTPSSPTSSLSRPRARSPPPNTASLASSSCKRTSSEVSPPVPSPRPPRPGRAPPS